MKKTVKFATFVCLFGVFIFWKTGCTGTSLPNLSEECYTCLCHVSTGCNFARECTDGYCGPFKISRIYWADAGKEILPDDEPERNLAWQDCARNYDCAKRLIKNYLEKYGQDCNGDGVTNCYDYIMAHFNGGNQCYKPLNETEAGRQWLQRYDAKCLSLNLYRSNRRSRFQNRYQSNNPR